MKDNPPQRIILTHQHEDHIGGLPAMKQAWTDIPVYAPAEHTDIIIKGYTVPEYRIHYRGDLYLAPKLPNAFYETNVPDMIESLEKLLAVSPDFTLCPSHGKALPDGPARIQKLLKWYKSEQENIQDWK